MNTLFLPLDNCGVRGTRAEGGNGGLCFAQIAGGVALDSRLNRGQQATATARTAAVAAVRSLGDSESQCVARECLVRDANGVRRCAMTELCQGPDPAPRRPLLQIPAGATDTHFHVFGPPDRYRYVPEREYTPPDALPQHCGHLFQTLGIGRAVLVQPSVYGSDNRCQIDAASMIGIPARVVVVPYEAPEQELERLHQRGARAACALSRHIGVVSRSRISSGSLTGYMAAGGIYNSCCVRGILSNLSLVSRTSGPTSSSTTWA